MITIGIIFVAWQSADLLPRSLTPWIEARKRGVEGCQIRICAVSVPFAGFDQGGEAPDGTSQMLSSYLAAGEIDSLISDTSRTYTETEARGMALDSLVAGPHGAHYLWQVDGDEFYTLDQISSIIRFVEANPYISCFRLSLKNRVFTPDQYLSEPFTPMRIHKVQPSRDLVVCRFCDDNNVEYLCMPIGLRHTIRDVEMSNLTVPAAVAWIDHWTWLSSVRSQRKVAYQQARGWSCSFAWDDSLGLTFNRPYYTSRGLPVPIVLSDLTAGVSS